jgi:sugar phosphate isomerase/epimerase
MPSFSRREFLRVTSASAAAAFFANSFELEKKKMMLSFSTLACPDWSFTDIVSFAKQHHYVALELRGIKRQMDLPLCPEFRDENRNATLTLMKENGLRFINLGSSCTLHFPEGDERKKNINEGKRFIDLAQQVECPYIRVFPNNFPKGQEKKTTLDLITKGLVELGDYAKDRNVKVLMETHGELVYTDDLASVMKAAAHDHVGLVWDPCNMWTVTKEPVRKMYDSLAPYILHTHIKDCLLVDGKPEYRFLGKGEVPIFEAIELLRKGGYKGYYSFEWEKLWHPELAEPELALADYPLVMKRKFS